MNKPNNSEQGVALVATLCALFTAGLLAAAVTAISQINTIDVGTTIQYARSAYVAEGASNRIIWLITADRFNYDTVEVGEVSYDDYDTDRYIADGVTHTLDYYGVPVEFTISDVVSGFMSSDVSSEFDYITQQEENLDMTDTIEELEYRYEDYTDSGDELADSSSYEVSDYETEYGIDILPRNASMQYREEFLYIPGFRDVFPTDSDGRFTEFMLIPPIDMSISDAESPSIMGATKLQLMSRGGLEEEDAEEVLEAIAEYRSDNTLMSESLEIDTITMLKQSFSWEESGNYTINIRRAAKDGNPSCRLVLSFTAFSESGPDDDIIQFLEFFRY